MFVSTISSENRFHFFQMILFLLSAAECSQKKQRSFFLHGLKKVLFVCVKFYVSHFLLLNFLTASGTFNSLINGTSFWTNLGLFLFTLL